MNPRLLSILLTIAALAATLTACREDTDPGEILPPVTNIVTFEGNNDRGARFTFVSIDDAPVLELQSSVVLDTAVAREGRRMVIRYIPPGGDATISGDINLRSADGINGGDTKIEPIANYPLWNRDGVYLYAAWRAGNYINIHGMLPYDETPRQFKLVADEATIDNPIVDVYLVHQLKNEVNSYLRRYYASFSIADVWERPECRGINLHIANTNLPAVNTFQFLKP